MEFVTLAEVRRNGQSALVKSAYEELKDCIGGEFQPG